MERKTKEDGFKCELDRTCTYFRRHGHHDVVEDGETAMERSDGITIHLLKKRCRVCGKSWTQFKR